MKTPNTDPEAAVQEPFSLVALGLIVWFAFWTTFIAAIWRPLAYWFTTKRICSWCGPGRTGHYVWVGGNPFANKRSDGICADCYAKLKAETHFNWVVMNFTSGEFEQFLSACHQSADNHGAVSGTSSHADVVKLKLEHAQATAAMEKEIADVQKRHQESLLSLANQIETKEAGVFVYCQRNRAALFPDKKSVDLLLAVVGFENTPHRVGKVSSKDTWPIIGKRLEGLDWGTGYIRYPDPEPNKEQLLADRTKFAPEQLKEAGIKFEQDENFFIRPKSEVAEQSIREAA